MFRLSNVARILRSKPNVLASMANPKSVFLLSAGAVRVGRMALTSASHRQFGGTPGPQKRLEHITPPTFLITPDGTLKDRLNKLVAIGMPVSLFFGGCDCVFMQGWDTVLAVVLTFHGKHGLDAIISDYVPQLLDQRLQRPLLYLNYVFAILLLVGLMKLTWREGGLCEPIRALFRAAPPKEEEAEEEKTD